MKSKRDTLTMMFVYTRTYLKQQIEATTGDSKAVYEAELKAAEELYEELFFKAHKGEL